MHTVELRSGRPLFSLPRVRATHKLRSGLGFALLAAVCFVGCVTSKYTLIPPEQAKVDKTLIGDFESVDVNGRHTTILVRNLDDKQYYVETEPADGDKPTRYAAFIATVKDVTFAHLREIRDDGVVPGEWILLRIDLAGDKLTLRPLSEEFFKQAKVDSAETLRQWVEANLDHRDFYDHNAALICTRMK